MQKDPSMRRMGKPTSAPVRVGINEKQQPLAERQALKLVSLLVSAESSWRAALIRQFRAQSLSKATGQYALLKALLAASELGMTVGEISEHLKVTYSNVARLVDGLERERLVNRRKSPTDSRRTYVVLTAAGRDIALCVAPIESRLATRLATAFTLQEQTTLMSYLERLETTVKQM